MYKVVVIDQEPEVLQWAEAFDWEAGGFSLCGTADSREKTAAIIRERQPDLVVIDILAPALGGFEWIRSFRRAAAREAAVIAVSRGYRFAAAQQAIQERCDRYLLKPFDTAEWLGTLRDMRAMLETRQAEEAARRVRKALAASAAIQELLRSGSEEAVEAAERVLEADRSTCCRLVLLETAPGPAAAGSAAGGPGAFFAQLAAVLQADIRREVRVHPFEAAGNLAGLLLLSEEEGADRPDEHIRAIAGRLPGGFRILAAHSSARSRGLTGLRSLYVQLAGRKREPLEGIARASISFMLEGLAAETQSLIGAVTANDAAAVAERTMRLHGLVRLASPSGHALRLYYANLRGELLRLLLAAGRDPDDPPAWLLQDEPGASSAAAFASRAAWEAACLSTARELAAMRAGQPDSAVAEAIAHIRRHYREKLQLQELAERFGLQPVQLGRQLKKETGRPFHAFIHGLRIAEAQKLLRRTDMKMTDIASTLGYHDQDYFAEKFRALTKLSPSAYKKLCQERREPGGGSA